MTLTPGTKLGPDEILALIGAGGTGEVCRARLGRRDTNAETMTAILKDDPPELLGSGVQIPPALDRIVRVSSPPTIAVFADPPLITSDGASFACDCRLRRSYLYTVNRRPLSTIASRRM